MENVNLIPSVKSHNYRSRDPYTRYVNDFILRMIFNVSLREDDVSV